MAGGRSSAFMLIACAHACNTKGAVLPVFTPLCFLLEYVNDVLKIRQLFMKLPTFTDDVESAAKGGVTADEGGPAWADP